MADVIQRSLASGELAPALRARADLTKYTNGLALCENFVIRPQGGAYFRAGTRYIGETLSSVNKSVLVPFKFNTTDSYILVFSNYTLMFVKNGVVIESSPGIPYQITTPFLVDYLFDGLRVPQFIQDGDIMTIVFRDMTVGTGLYPVKELKRISDTNWTLTDVSFSASVTAPVQNALTVVGTGGGTYVKYYGYAVTAVDADGEESLVSNYHVTNTNSLTETYGIHVSWGAVTGAVYYRVYKEANTPNGATTSSGVYGWIGDTEDVQFDDFNLAPITSDAPKIENTPFATYPPGVISSYKQRSIFANKIDDVNTFYVTEVGIPNSLRSSRVSKDTDGFQYMLKGNQVNGIRHIVPVGDSGLIILTAGGEWIITEGRDELFVPSIVGARRVSYNGASLTPPVVVNDAVIYSQPEGDRIRELEYGDNGVVGTDLSLTAEHLFEGHSIVQMGYADYPDKVILLLRDDGVMVALTYVKEHQVWAWHHHNTDGLIESFAVIKELYNGKLRDAVYWCVNRTINGSTKRYIERQEPRITTSPQEAFFLDCALTYSGAATTTITGADHLEGKDVVIVADGNVVEGLTVVSGSVALPAAASKVILGLSYTGAIEMLDLDIASLSDPIRNKAVSIGRVDIDFEKTRGGWVGSINDDGTTGTMREIAPREITGGYDPIAITDHKAEIVIDPTWTKSGRIRIEQRAPFPMGILSVTPHVSVGG